MTHRLVIWLIFLAMSPLAHAQSSSIASFKGWPIERVSVRGVPDGLADILSRGLASSRGGGLFGGQRAMLYREVVAADAERIRLYLAQNGYPYAEVVSLYEPDGDRRRVHLIFTVTLGAEVTVGELRVTGIPEEVEPVDWIDLESGATFRDAALGASRETLRAALRERGYARAEVESRLESIDLERVRVHIAVEPGDRYTFDGVRVEGARPDLAPLAGLVTDVESGDPYSTAALKRARYQLQLLDLFTRIQLSTVDSGPGRLDLVVDVTERPLRSTEVGLGYWTDDLFRVQAMWRHRNLFGRGRSFRVNGFASGRRRQAGASATWPGIWGARIQGRVRGSFEEQLEETYDLTDVGGDAALTYRHSLASTLGGGLELSWITVDEKTDDAVYEEEGGRVLVGYLTWTRATTDDPVEPARGTDVRWHAESTMPGALSESHHVRFEAAARAYTSPLDGLVLAARVGGGVAWPTEDSVDLLPSTRFFAGGGRSMRGFRRRRLGPVDSDLDPVGGQSLVEMSVEARAPLWWKLRVAAFFDAANVWSDRDDTTLDDLEFAVGPALMVSTPVGPIRGDLGVRVGTIDDGEPRTAFHLSIGHPF